jgi:probable F420-dependent oxidoreductase
MKISLIPINVSVASVDQMIGFAQLAESLGIESVWTFEHVIVPLKYDSKYPYDTSGKMGATPNTNFIDPLIALTAIAANTKTLRLGTGVNILSQANPLLLAKQAASLDFISKGRFMLGVGIGWLQEEFLAMGVPFEKRGARFDDYVQAIRKVWSGDVVEHQSEFLQWSGFKSFPLPVQTTVQSTKQVSAEQKPGVPIIIGGTKGRVYERIAQYGDGWYAPMTNPEEIALRLAELQVVCEQQGRDYASLDITAMWFNDGGLERVKQFQALGVNRLTVPVNKLGSDPVEGLKKLSAEVIACL